MVSAFGWCWASAKGMKLHRYRTGEYRTLCYKTIYMITHQPDPYAQFRGYTMCKECSQIVEDSK